jgi:hypothetical protein
MAGTAQDVPAIAAKEVGTHWRTDESRILEYFRASTGLTWTKREALTQSWCSHFVMWVLAQAKLDPLPLVGTPPPDNFSVGRFTKGITKFGVYDTFPVNGNYVPKPGDLYYLPASNDHIGIIEDVTPGANNAIMITTINGNGYDSAHRDYSQIVQGQDGKWVQPIGGGIVARNGPTNLCDGKPNHLRAVYIALPGP